MNTVCLYTKSGEAHGLINVQTNAVPSSDYKHMEPSIKAKLEKERKEDARMVKAEYWNSRGRHERLTVQYCKYAGDPIQTWHLVPGNSYELPYGLVKQVNDPNKHMKKRSGLLSIDGSPLNKDESPLSQDQEGEWLHKLVAVGF